MSTGLRSALVLFAHGSRDPGWAEPFVKIRQAVTERCPGVEVELAFLESMAPRIGDAVDRLAGMGIGEITVAPLFMAQGGHLKEDVPKLIAELNRRHPGIRMRVLPAVGEVDTILIAIADWLTQSLPKDTTKAQP